MKSEDSKTEGRRKALLQRCRELNRRKKRADVVYLAACGTDSLGVTGEKWDSDPWLLGVANGVLDLRTGELRPGRPEYFIRTASPVEWKGREAKAPTWEKFLQSTFAGDSDLIFYLQRLFGYGLTGLIVEHVMIILWGLGRNGKGTLIEVIGVVLGLLAGPIQAELLLEQGRSRSSAGASPDILGLRGKRIVWASETDEGRRLNAGRVKWLTGGDTLTARGLYAKREVTFQPSHLLCLLTNHKPMVDADDFALWQRLHLIPFNVRFVDNPEAANEAPRDPDLKAKLLAEAPGILAWLVAGCLDWQKDGLGVPPAAVAGATNEYRENEDLLNHFIEDECQIGQEIQAQAGHLYEAYKTWAVSGGLRPVSHIKFSEQMGRKFEPRITRNRKFFLGVGLLTPGEAGGEC
ncbi:MAG: phage/plasmid primase, P4 family [Pseudomonadota bacterium]